MLNHLVFYTIRMSTEYYLSLTSMQTTQRNNNISNMVNGKENRNIFKSKSSLFTPNLAYLPPRDEIEACEQRLTLLNISGEQNNRENDAAPIISSHNDKVRPLLDAVDRLRHLKIMQEGIQLPTIVVVGDQSYGKSSVLESLAGISLPREFNGKIIPTDESHIADAIVMATNEIAGKGKGILNNPLTLIVKKKGVPDLTMVDLPGITRVPIIKEFITPEESIILNVLSASVDFTTCESIRMSQQVDKIGERTLVVVTKADKSPEGLLEKVIADDVNIGLGYVCVSNRIGDESYEQARAEENKFFESHHLLSKISKSIVGIPILAQKLVQIQATIIVKCLPDIVQKINDKISSNMEDLNKLPQIMTSISEAMTTFMNILGLAKESLRKILLRGEFDEYPDEMEMHCTARFADMLNQYSSELQSKSVENYSNGNFLLEEIRVLEETKAIGLPNFLPRAVFLTLLQKKMKTISFAPFEFVEKTWNYLEKVLISVLMRHSDNYPQLLSSTRRAAHNLVAKKEKQSVDWVSDLVEMGKLTDYTCNPEYALLNDHSKPSKVQIDELGEIEVGQLRSHVGVVQEAFDMKIRMTTYWSIVLRRWVDSMALNLLFSIQKLVNKEMEFDGLEKMLEESPNVAEKRKRLENSIKLLMGSKDVVANIIDKITTNVN
ncbi:hypothetical protein ACJIZ3_000378 [Penstemon smallii]|uniref:Dynamin-type G domain-containing protein n=1 Tax=Penstemon smallii TaxID=265156 RepID=A0ABD3RC24_9LAMI